MIEHGTHIDFVPAPPKPKTLTWWVVSHHEDIQLGTIAWFGRWRRYSFHPQPGTVFEQVCLREIAEFCERKTREHQRRKQKPHAN